MKCYQVCAQENLPCLEEKCRMWIDYSEDLNCTNIAIAKHKVLTLRQVADRMGLSFMRIKQLQDRAIEKVKKRISHLE